MNTEFLVPQEKVLTLSQVRQYYLRELQNHKKVEVMLSARIITVFLSLSCVCSAQHDHPVTRTSGRIDGAATPQLIPDSTAYRVLFRAFTADDNLARQRAMLSGIQLSAADFSEVLVVAQQFQALRAAYLQSASAASAAALKSGTTMNQAALATQQAAIGTTVKSLLQSSLSVSGMARFDSYVQAQKRSMTVFPLPDMNGAK